MDLHVLYPAYCMTVGGLLTPAKNSVLADLAWDMAKRNAAKDHTFQAHTDGYHKIRPECMFERFKEAPEVRELAVLADSIAREYLLRAYGYLCKEPINMLAETFCQDETTGTSGMATHTHNAPINVVYYPRIRKDDVADATTGRAGRNGELDFFNPTGAPKKPWPCLARGHHHASIFRVNPVDGLAVCFEGYMPHSAAQFQGQERTVITVSCTPKMPGKNDGLTLEELTA